MSQPCDSTEPHTPVEALLQTSRPLVTPPPRYCLLCSSEHWISSVYSNYAPFLSPATISFHPIMLSLAFVLIIVSLLWWHHWSVINSLILFRSVILCSFPCRPPAHSRLFYIPAVIVYNLCTLRGQLLSLNILSESVPPMNSDKRRRKWRCVR